MTHSKYKEDLKKMGTTHGHPVTEDHGHHSNALHDIESKHLEGKKHHRDEMI